MLDIGSIVTFDKGNIGEIRLFSDDSSRVLVKYNDPQHGNTMKFIAVEKVRELHRKEAA